ncbi:MAG: hypothetical protein ABIB97_03015 [Patescibacteria group bacterium]
MHHAELINPENWMREEDGEDQPVPVSQEHDLAAVIRSIELEEEADDL